MPMAEKINIKVSKVGIRELKEIIKKEIPQIKSFDLELTTCQFRLGDACSPPPYMKMTIDGTEYHICDRCHNTIMELSNLVETSLKCQVCGFEVTPEYTLYIGAKYNWDPDLIGIEGWSLPLLRKKDGFELTACSKCFNDIITFKGTKQAHN